MSRNGRLNNGVGPTEGAKERILDAAADLFAQKGYDGAGVDEIAVRAGVTKAMIYYYFQSKQALLDALVMSYVDRIVREKERYADGPTPLSKASLHDRFDERMSGFSGDNRVLKIIAMEMLKQKPAGESVLSIIQPLFTMGIPKLDQLGIKIDDVMALKVSSFFFGTIPVLMLALMGDRFCEFHGITEEELNERFADAFKQMYLGYFSTYFDSKRT